MTNTAAWPELYLSRSASAVIKELELPYIYHLERDELYELNEEAVEFLRKCNGALRGAELGGDADFVEYCLDEELLTATSEPHPLNTPPAGRAPRPSLRYLELQLTQRCNFACRHCYLGPASPEDLPLADAEKIVREFAGLQGLRLLFSGGEPLLYPYLDELLAVAAELPLRRVLLSNGSLLTPERARRLKVHEVQFSLDGWEAGHEKLRGPGSFALVMHGIEAAREAGLQISLATMIHRHNLGEFERMNEFALTHGVREWSVDAPGVAGALAAHPDLVVSPKESAAYLKYSFGGGYHGAGEGFACGLHLMTITPQGQALKCGFFPEKPLGHAAREGLETVWRRLIPLPLSELDCRSCGHLNECAGGCRFRASGPTAPDPFMCAYYG